jgi:hypothetical protein
VKRKDECLPTSFELALFERSRAIDRGYGSAHDDKTHKDGSLARAGAHVAAEVALGKKIRFPADDPGFPAQLAEHVREKYGRNKLRRLAIAAGLILADIDRRIRAGEFRADYFKTPPAKKPRKAKRRARKAK